MEATSFQVLLLARYREQSKHIFDWNTYMYIGLKDARVDLFHFATYSVWDKSEKYQNKTKG